MFRGPFPSFGVYSLQHLSCALKPDRVALSTEIPDTIGLQLWEGKVGSFPLLHRIASF